MGHRRGRLRRLLIALAALVLAVGGTALWVGNSLVSSVNRDIGPPPTDLPFNELMISSDSGTEVATWYAKAANAPATVILLHPIRGSRNSMLRHAALFYEAGYSVLSIDMQAHGESMGDNITLGHLESLGVKAAVDHVRKQNPNGKVAIIGNSLGGAAAVLGAPLEVEAMVLESVYPTIEKAISNRIRIRIGPLCHLVTPLLTWQIPPRLGVSLDELRPVDAIKNVKCPVLILAGQEDRHTTIEDSKTLFAAANEPKQMEVFDNARHRDLLKFAPTRYKDTVLPFLAAHLGEAKTEATTEED